MSATCLEYEPRSAEQFDFSRAPLFRKSATLKKASVEWATERTDVVTNIGGIEETKNIAQPGDAIVTGPAGERYVVAGRKFSQLYEETPADPTRYVSKNVVRAIQLARDTEIVAPWGEKQRVKAKGYVVQSVAQPSDVYLIEEGAFAATYSPFERH
jgi:hypothetical protein